MIVAKKALGQHFLRKKEFLYNILRSTQPLQYAKHIIEIGPGTGCLTELLLQTGLPVTAIETDVSLLNFLTEKFIGQDLKLIHADALEFDFASLSLEKPILIANLPYNISVPLILNYFQNTKQFVKYCVLIQKEVAMRLYAKPRTKDYGRVSVLAQAYCDIVKHFDVPGNAFTPPTKVTSSFVSLVPHDRYKGVEFDVLSKIVAICFRQRRKMLRSSVPDKKLLETLKNCGVSDTVRAEEITVDQFVECARRWKMED